MAKRVPMTDAELVAYIETLESQTSGNVTDPIAVEQAKAMDYYNVRPLGTEEEGRSQAKTSDVYDVVEGMTPLVVKPFVSSDDLVKFTPVGPDDVEASEQETQYINYIVTQKNSAFETLVSWCKVGLLQKNGIVKYWWEKTQKNEVHTYYDQPAELFAFIEKDPDIQVTEHTANDDGTHDFTVRIVKDVGQAVYAVVPPEEFRIARSATSPDPQKASFVQHTPTMTISAIREMGYDIPDDIADMMTQDPRTSPQYLARHTTDQLGMTPREDSPGDPSMREVVYRETYLRVDRDGDGIAELRKVCLVGSTLLMDEEVEEIPFCAWTPIIQPFRFHGRCPADETIETQMVKTTLLRQTLDNIYGVNNNRVYIGPEVNVDDYVDNQIGGLVRVGAGDVNDQVREASVTPINGITMPLIEFMDSEKENRTGFSKYNQGTDSNSLNKTATGIRLIQEAGNERIGLISRSFAELGLKPLMLGIHGLCRRHATQTETVELRGKWVQIDPRAWRQRMDMSVSVGLGNSDKQMQMQGAQLLMQKQMELSAVPAGAGLVTTKNLFAAAAKLANAVGEKNPEQYFTMPEEQIGPDGQPIPQGPPEQPDPMQNPEFMIKVSENKLKQREVAVKEREMALRESEARRAGLESHAKLAHEMEMAYKLPPEERNEPMEADDSQEKQAVEAVAKTQESMMAALERLAAAMEENTRLLSESIQRQSAPKVITVEKGADGRFVGKSEPVNGVTLQ